MTFAPNNILVIDFGQLGDVVMSLPALRAIRERFPHARITILLVGPEERAIIPQIRGLFPPSALILDRLTIRLRSNARTAGHGAHADVVRALTTFATKGEHKGS